MSPLKRKISIFSALALLALTSFIAVSRFSNPVEQELLQNIDYSQSSASDSGDRDSTGGLESVDVLLIGLKQRLESQPGDMDGWVLLSKSYYHLNRETEAQQAFEKAEALGYKGNWQPMPRIDSFSQNNLSLQNYNSPINIRDYGNNEGVNPAISRDGEAIVESGPSPPADLKLKVSLNPTLQRHLSAESPVFVFARAAGNPGPPLAVVRKTVDELPFEIVLNDSHAMIPGKTISSAKNVILGARVSVSGLAQRQAGDYEQLSNSIPSNSNETIELVISDKI